MEFWGVEVKPGEALKCDPGVDKYLHLSQASLGETKGKGTENVPIFVKFNDQKLVLGTLSAEKCAQISYDLVFEKEFELSHNSKNSSVCFCGYKAVIEDGDYDSEEFEIGQKANGKPELKDEQGRPATAKANAASKADASIAKPKAKVEELKKLDKSKADDEDDEDSSDDEDEDGLEEDEPEDDEDMTGGLSDTDSDDEDEDESSDEDEATPEKPEIGKKRKADSATNTPAAEKKAKVITPAGSQKTGGDGKRGVHAATPHPAKQVTKDKPKQQTPKSTGSVTCKSCTKSFNSDNALQAHSKAKHSK